MHGMLSALVLSAQAHVGNRSDAGAIASLRRWDDATRSLIVPYAMSAR
jgi:hypothetical protein